MFQVPCLKYIVYFISFPEWPHNITIMYHYCLMINKIEEMQKRQAKLTSYTTRISQILKPRPADSKSHIAKTYTSLQILWVSPISGVFGDIIYSNGHCCNQRHVQPDQIHMRHTLTNPHLIPTLHTPPLLSLRLDFNIEAQWVSESVEVIGAFCKDLWPVGDISSSPTILPEVCL